MMSSLETRSVIECLSEFKATRLGNSRNIHVYLPPGYHEHTDKRYPVVYMHAGQRAFGLSKPGQETWQMDVAADRLIGLGLIEELIIVGISHVRPVTHNEFYHYAAPVREAVSVGCSGLLYEHFIVHELKPFIDRRYRTLTEPEHTGMIGSSAAALCTFHIGMRHPDVFGKLMMLSPFFYDVQLDASSPGRLKEEPMIRLPAGKPDVRMWMDIGDMEGLFLPSQIREVVDQLLNLGYVAGKDLIYLEQPDAGHQEADWAERVHLPLLCMFGKKGSPASLELKGRSVIGLKGDMKCRINALLRYDNGVKVSLLEGTYISEQPDVLKVLPDGTLIPVATGRAVVRLQFGELTATKAYTVVEELSGHVLICLSAQSPSREPAEDTIYGGMGMKLKHVGDGHYEGCFEVPRDSGFRFRFTRGFRRFETDPDGRPMPNRVFRATHPQSLHYTIRSWGDSPARNETRR